jgi:WD40 repeat protein
MNLQSNDFSYQVGGSLSAEDTAYVERQADRQLSELLQKGEYCFVFNSRQMGKSSLRVRATQKLQRDGVACATIDPQMRGTTLREDQWYAGTIKRLIDDLYLKEKINFASWWKELESQSISAVERCYDFVDRILLTEISQNIVIFVEEIDNLLSLDFDTDGFFMLIRLFHERRAEDPRYKRLTFAFLGVTTPADLIASKHSSSFNIGRAVEMSGFQLHEVKPLQQGLVGKVDNPQAVLEQVLKWTGGQPFLTQKVLNLVLETANLSRSPQALVDPVVTHIVNNWESHDVPPHLKTIRDRLLRSDERLRGRLLGLYQQIVAEGSIEGDDSYEQLQLRLTGLVVKRENRLEVNNPIYAAVFNRTWVDMALANLRPAFYAEAFKAWQTVAEEQKESFLLWGQALRDAEAWSKGKQLNEEDALFLDVSHKLEREETQRSIQIEREEKAILEMARQKANQRIQSGSAILGLMVVLAIATGFYARLQFLEANRQINEAQVKSIVAELQLAEADFSAGRSLLGLVQSIRAGRKWQLLTDLDEQTQNTTVAQQLIALLSKVHTIKEHNFLKSEQRIVNSVNFSLDGQKIVSAGDDGTIKLWKKDGTLLTTIISNQLRVNSVNFSLDGQKIVSAGDDDTIKLWQPDGTLLTTIISNQRIVNTVNFSSDGQKIVSAGDDGTIKLWRSDGTLLTMIISNQRIVNSANFSSNGQKIVSAGDDDTIKLWQPDGTLLKAIKSNQLIVNNVNFSSNGQKIVSAGDDGTIKLWQADGTLLTTIKSNQFRVNSVNFSSDGQKIVSAGDDGTIKLWQADGTLLTTIKSNDRVNSVNFSSDGKTLISGGFDGSVRLWKPFNPILTTIKGDRKVQVQDLLQLACNWASEYLRTNPDVTDRDRALCFPSKK